MKTSRLFLPAIAALALFGAGCAKPTPSPIPTATTTARIITPTQKENTKLGITPHTESSDLDEILKNELLYLEKYASTTYKILEIRPYDYERDNLILITEKGAYQLWHDSLRDYAQDYYSPRLVKAGIVNGDISLTQTGTNYGDYFLLTMGFPNMAEQYVYSNYGEVIYSFTQPLYDTQEKATITDVYGKKTFTLEPVFSTPCSPVKTSNYSNDQEAILSGLAINGKVTSFPKTSVQCFVDDGMNYSNSYYPQFKAVGFDPKYSTFELILPDEKRHVLIDVTTGKIVSKKQVYNSPCTAGSYLNPDEDEDLTLTTPSSTTIVVKNPWSQVKITEPGVVNCLEWIHDPEAPNPKFRLWGNQAEGPGTDMGTYQLDIQTGKLKKISQ